MKYHAQNQKWLLRQFHVWREIVECFTISHLGDIYNIRRTSVGNKIVDHSDVVGASHVGAAPTTSSFST